MAIDTLGANALASNSVTSAKIADGAVVAADVADGFITTAKLADDAITGAKLANDIAISTTGNIATTGSGTVTSAGAITASAGVAVGGTGAANTLDDYEEGTFTPTLFGSTTGTGSTGSTTGTGNYRKVGSICTIQVYFSNATLSSQSGQLSFGALPFASIGAYGVGAPMMYGVDFPANSYVVGYISGTSVGMYSVTDNAGWGQVAVENQSGLYLTHAFTYITT